MRYENIKIAKEDFDAMDFDDKKYELEVAFDDLDFSDMSEEEMDEYYDVE